MRRREGGGGGRRRRKSSFLENGADSATEHIEDPKFTSREIMACSLFEYKSSD